MQHLIDIQKFLIKTFCMDVHIYAHQGNVQQNILNVGLLLFFNWN